MNKEFNSITQDILALKEFQKLQMEPHHGINRYDHSIHVASLSYKIAKLFSMDYKRVTRAALLHDFYTNKDTFKYSKRETLHTHPCIALKNAKIYFSLTPMEENIIVSHMYPLKGVKPSYKESYLVSIADKIVAAREMYRYKFSRTLGLWIIFLFNVISIQK